LEATRAKSPGSKGHVAQTEKISKVTKARVAKTATEAYPVVWVRPSSEEVSTRRQYFADDSWIERSVVFSPACGVYMPERFLDVAEEIYNFEVRPTDIWVVTYPKCGTTVIQELLWQLSRGVDSSAFQHYLYGRSPFLEFCVLNLAEIDTSNFAGKMMHRVMRESIDWARSQPEGQPRIIKTHLPFDLLPPNLLETAKVVYVARNPRDCCVSYYHHQALFDEGYRFTGDFEDFSRLFREGMLNYGNYWSHLKAAWANRCHPNFKMVWYEDIVRDRLGVIRDLSAFTGFRVPQQKMEDLSDMLKVENFRRHHAEGAGDDAFNRARMEKFVRKAKVGDWKNAFCDVGEAERQRWDDWIRQHLDGDLGGEMPMAFEL